MRPVPGLALIGALAVLAACAHQAGTSPVETASSPVAGTGRVGYVNLDQLVKKHPMYVELAKLDQDVDALKLKSVASSVAVSPQDLQKANAELQKELDAAKKHAQATLSAQAAEMQQRENDAIRQALSSSGVTGGGGSIAAGINANVAAQQQRVGSEAQKDFESYRAQLVAQDQSALHALEASYNARAAREFRAKASALQSQESAYALQLADDDKADRLSLRTKLSNLPLDDSERADTRTQLEAIDRKEADLIGQMRNRDQAQLAGLQQTLHKRVASEVGAAAADIQRKTVAKINAHAATTQQIAQNAAGGSIVQSAGGASLSPEMQGRLKALQTKFQHDFDDEKKQTLADFQKTQVDLTKKFERLTGVDRAADAGTQRQIEGIQKQRGDLYDSMIAAIQREVRSVAQQRGIGVVFSDVVAPAGGVDLTSDAEKVVESLPK